MTLRGHGSRAAGGIYFCLPFNSKPCPRQQIAGRDTPGNLFKIVLYVLQVFYPQLNTQFSHYITLPKRGRRYAFTTLM